MIYIHEYTSGAQPVVCIHGWGGDHREYAPLAALRPPGLRLLSVDLPGYGQSPLPPEWNVSSISAQLAEAIEPRLERPAVLVGFCSGALFALCIARDHPQLARSLVLIDPFAFMPWYFRLFTWGEFGRRAYATSFQSRLGRRITDGALKRAQHSNEDFTSAFSRLDASLTLSYLRLLRTARVRDDFASIKLPIDLIYGAHTFGAVRSSIGQLQSIWPQARLHELPKVGHLPLIKGARAINAILSASYAEGPPR